MEDWNESRRIEDENGLRIPTDILDTRTPSNIMSMACLPLAGNLIVWLVSKPQPRLAAKSVAGERKNKEIMPTVLLRPVHNPRR